MGVVKAARDLGIEGDLAEHAHHSWRPWRSYAVQYLWSSSDDAFNYFPEGQP